MSTVLLCFNRFKYEMDIKEENVWIVRAEGGEKWGNVIFGEHLAG